MTSELLPRDAPEATLVGRLDLGEGPTPVVIRRGRVLDVSGSAPTVSALLNTWSGRARGTDIGSLADFAFHPAWGPSSEETRLLAPIDLQCIKAMDPTARSTELFTKAQPLSAAGWGQYIGVGPNADGRPSRPAIVLVCNSSGRIIGATLGNDTNSSDCAAVGPFIRIFDTSFSLSDVLNATLELRVNRPDGRVLDETVHVSGMARSPAAFVEQMTREHGYPDGIVLFMGASSDTGAFAEDIVQVSTPKLGTLVNRMTSAAQAPPWTFGVGRLMANLALRGLLL